MPDDSLGRVHAVDEARRGVGRRVDVGPVDRVDLGRDDTKKRVDEADGDRLDALREVVEELGGTRESIEDPHERTRDGAHLVEGEAVEMNAHDLLDARARDLDGLLQALEHPLAVSEQLLLGPRRK